MMLEEFLLWGAVSLALYAVAALREQIGDLQRQLDRDNQTLMLLLKEVKEIKGRQDAI